MSTYSTIDRLNCIPKIDQSFEYLSWDFGCYRISLFKFYLKLSLTNNVYDVYILMQGYEVEIINYTATQN